MPARRKILQAWLLAVATSTAARARGVWAGFDPARRQAAVNRESLAAFLDTLLPHHLGPSASAMGVPQALLAHAATHPQFAQLLIDGCVHLDAAAQARGADRFADLPETSRIEIVAAAERSSSASVSRQFFEHVRRQAFRHYYENSAAWAFLDFDGPPQPRGFTDYTRRPSP